MLNRRTAPALLAVIGVASFLALPTNAGAAVTCVRAGTTAEISLGVAADVATVKRSGAAIQVNGASCGTATVNNIDQISATGTNDSSQRVVLDLGGGAFAPGVEVEAGGGALSRDRDRRRLPQRLRRGGPGGRVDRR